MAEVGVKVHDSNVVCIVCVVPMSEVQRNTSTSIAVKDDDEWVDKSMMEHARIQPESLKIQSECMMTIGVWPSLRVVCQDQ